MFMSNWELVLGNVPTEPLAMISYYLASDKAAQALHMIKLYSASSPTSIINGAASTILSHGAIRGEKETIISTINEIINSRCRIEEPA
ncbi:hypothetical protein QGN29_14135 [Temperatibacter marinus]|uniref:Uncharacterized protein n=1 Tax=Temperatibacter marinus TaxID=1456591 RepID=A0AA52EGG8_9PROT|nr:hypothetical protein [Temperatibacter marinus]WND02688.1 hypothetical protein QGN29_14135 [Temperatibacter marinus]